MSTKVFYVPIRGGLLCDFYKQADLSRLNVFIGTESKCF